MTPPPPWVVGVRCPTYRDRMSPEEPSAEPEVMQMFDSEAGPGLTCRVCGALVSEAGAYPRAHWDWHEASNGA